MQKRKIEQFGWVEQFGWTRERRPIWLNNLAGPEKLNNLAGPENEGKSLEGRQRSKNKNTYTHRKRRKGERKKTLLDDSVLTPMA